MPCYGNKTIAAAKMVFFMSLAACGIFIIQVLYNKPVILRSTANTRLIEKYKILKVNRTSRHETVAVAMSTSVPESRSPGFLELPSTLTSSCWKQPCRDDREIKSQMLFLIKSATSHASFRELLRRTWASYSYVEGIQFASVFILGKVEGKQKAVIEEEIDRYGDILLANITEKYSSVAEKTLAGMRWAVENLNDDVYYTSCDDDFMIDVGGLVKEIKWHQEKIKEEKWGEFPIICSYLSRVNDGPDRRDKSKYYVSYDEYKWRYWPDYCLGGAYTTSVGVIRQLWKAAQTTKQIRMDDVWITGVLREKIGMPRQYVRHLDTPIATHYSGFRGKIVNNRRDFMKDEWEKLRQKFSNLTICTC